MRQTSRARTLPEGAEAGDVRPQKQLGTDGAGLAVCPLPGLRAPSGEPLSRVEQIGLRAFRTINDGDSDGLHRSTSGGRSLEPELQRNEQTELLQSFRKKQ